MAEPHDPLLDPPLDGKPGWSRIELRRLMILIAVVGSVSWVLVAGAVVMIIWLFHAVG